MLRCGLVVLNRRRGPAKRRAGTFHSGLWGGAFPDLRGYDPSFLEVGMVPGKVARALLVVSLMLPAVPLLAQQTGAISGKVTATDGSVLPGVTVEARSDVPRVPA
jgi:hypothetical protein